MLLERGTRLLVGGVVRRDLGQRHAAQLGGKARTQRDDVHRRVLRCFCVCSTLHQNRWSDKPAPLAFDRGGRKDNARGLAYDRSVGEWMRKRGKPAASLAGQRMVRHHALAAEGEVRWLQV